MSPAWWWLHRYWCPTVLIAQAPFIAEEQRQVPKWDGKMDPSALRGAYPFGQRVGGVWIPGAGWALSFRVGRLAGISRTLVSLGLEEYCCVLLVSHGCLPSCASWLSFLISLSWGLLLCSGLKVSLTLMASQAGPVNPPTALYFLLMVFFQTRKEYFQGGEELLNYSHSADAFQ